MYKSAKMKDIIKLLRRSKSVRAILSVDEKKELINKGYRLKDDPYGLTIVMSDRDFELNKRGENKYLNKRV